jgi:hypothetical protein
VAEWLHAWQIWCKKDIVGEREKPGNNKLDNKKMISSIGSEFAGEISWAFVW